MKEKENATDKPDDNGNATSNKISVDSSIPIAAPDSPREHYETKKACPKIKKWPIKKARFIITLIAAIGAVAATVFTGWQAWIARDTEYRQLRAYAHINFAGFMVVDVDKTPLALLGIAQQGLTPIRDARVKFGFAIQPRLKNNDYSVPQSRWIQGKPTLNMEMGERFPLRLAGNSYLTNDDLMDLQHRDNLLVLQGVLNYRDVFGDWHRSEFCFAADWQQITNNLALIEQSKQLVGAQPATICLGGHEET